MCDQISPLFGTSLNQAIYYFGCSTRAEVELVSFQDFARTIGSFHDSRVQLNVVQSVKSLFEGPYVLDSTPLCGRIVKAVLPSIMRMVISPPSDLEVPEIPSNKTKSGRKRARNFEGEEILKTPSEIICPMPEDREVVLISVDGMSAIFAVDVLINYRLVIGHLLRNPALSSAMTSIVGRVMVALLVTLPRRTISSLSPDPNFVPSLTKKVQALGFRIGSGTTSVMSKALPFIIEASLSDQESDVCFVAFRRVFFSNLLQIRLKGILNFSCTLDLHPWFERCLI